MGCFSSKPSESNDQTGGQRRPDRTEPLSPGGSTNVMFNNHTLPGPGPSVTGFLGEYNDTVIKPSHTVSGSVLSTRGSTGALSISRLDSARRPTLTYTNSLANMRGMLRIGNEVLCMTWNIHHDADCTPFDFYCDFRNLGIKERDAVSIEILWDVARVFFYPDQASQVCTATKLAQIVPPALLSDKALQAYIDAAEFEEKEANAVKDYPNISLHDFLEAHSLKEDRSSKRTQQFSFIRTHSSRDKRKSSPLRPSYTPSEFETLLVKEPKLLPVLILDSLHVFVIRFSHFLIENQLRKAFSEFEPQEQTSRVELFLSKHSASDLSIPKPFCDTRHRLFECWRDVFKNSNKIEQIAYKVRESRTDIVLLQRVSKGAFTELKARFTPDNWAVIPAEFPSDLEESTVMCLRKENITPGSKEQVGINQLNFVKKCTVGSIPFVAGVVSLTPGSGCGPIRQKQVKEYTRLFKKHNAIIGGLFNEDLTDISNTVAQTLLRTLNGIDHTQEEPLAFSVNRTRTNLQFEIRKADKQDKGVQDGIFSTFPLVGEAFTDFQHSGLENPSDHGPVFQRIMLQT